MITNDIHQSRISVGKGIDFSHRFRFKKLSVASGNFEPMVNVFARFLLGQGINMVANRYSLSDCLVAIFVDRLVEFALTDKKNVDQFAVVHLDV